MDKKKFLISMVSLLGFPLLIILTGAIVDHYLLNPWSFFNNLPQFKNAIGLFIDGLVIWLSIMVIFFIGSIFICLGNLIYKSF